MPEELKNNGGANGEQDGGDAGAGQGAGAGDGADKGKGAGDGGSGQGAGADETITIKKSELEQIKTDRDNYKKIGLQKKADERSLDGKGAGDGKGGEGAGQGSAQVDEKKITETATAAANKTIRDASEKSAKRAFLKAHPEYLDDAAWTSLMAHLTFKGGEVTHEEIVDRMEAAVLEHKRSTGKLDEYLKSEHERGVREGRIQAEVGSGHGTGGAGDRNDGGKGAGDLSPKGQEMARAMHVDPAKAGKVDPTKDNVIDITKV